MRKSKTSYTKGALTEFIRGLAQLEGYESPARFLDEKLDEVKEFNDFEFECDFFLNVHYLCKEYAHEFWSIGHRKSISKWLKKSKIITNVFSTTWEFWENSPYQLDSEKFYFRAKAEFIREGVYQSEDIFISNQLERLNLLIDKYKTAIVNGRDINITQNQFIRLKEYRDYFKSVELSIKEVKSHSMNAYQSRTKQLIAEIFESMDKKGWNYAFVTEKDYNLFTDLLTNFFEYTDYSIPETVIHLKRTCRTKVAKALGKIHAELSENPLNSDAKYFEIVKVLNHFKEVSNFDLVRAMQK